MHTSSWSALQPTKEWRYWCVLKMMSAPWAELLTLSHCEHCFLFHPFIGKWIKIKAARACPFYRHFSCTFYHKILQLCRKESPQYAPFALDRLISVLRKQNAELLFQQLGNFYFGLYSLTNCVCHYFLPLFLLLHHSFCVCDSAMLLTSSTVSEAEQ